MNGNDLNSINNPNVNNGSNQGTNITPERFNNQFINPENNINNIQNSSNIDELSKMMQNQGKEQQFIKNTESPKDTRLEFLSQERYINNLNIDGAYNNIENNGVNNTIRKSETENKKATIKITGETKVFFLIIALIFIFIIFLPTIFDLINNIKYR